MENINTNNSLTRLIGGFIGERASEWLGRKVYNLTTGINASYRTIGGVIDKVTPSFFKESVRVVALETRVPIAAVISLAGKITGERIANIFFAPIFEELVYRVGFQNAFKYSLEIIFERLGASALCREITAQLFSIHLTAYLFAMAHGPITTLEGSLRYTRAAIRGVIVELGGRIASLEAMGLHIAYNALKATRFV